MFFNPFTVPRVAADPRGRLERVWSDCEADPAVYQLVLGWEDGSLMSLTPRGNIMFVREEGLSAIHTAQMVVRAVQDDSEVGRHQGNKIGHQNTVNIFVTNVQNVRMLHPM